ncbi:MAG: saccharopine dehydrogenase C-terminal domain-containing protein, partial [Actinomycetota bacterium]
MGTPTHFGGCDTQITSQPKQVDEFVNTWSIEGFYEEGVAPAELGWGTHERWLPHNAHVHDDDGPCNQIAIAQPGMETWVRSWVPC